MATDRSEGFPSFNIYTAAVHHKPKKVKVGDFPLTVKTDDDQRSNAKGEKNGHLPAQRAAKTYCLAKRGKSCA